MNKLKHSKNILQLIKVLHTIIWAFFVLIITYILYSGIFDKINIFTWISVVLILIEGIILLFNKWNCPLTILGKNYTEQTHIGFDIYLPKFIAKHNKLIFTTIYIIGLIIIMYRIMK
jgi:hypothetical protein